jgi:hypothetical protein
MNGQPKPLGDSLEEYLERRNATFVQFRKFFVHFVHVAAVHSPTAVLLLVQAAGDCCLRVDTPVGAILLAAGAVAASVCSCSPGLDVAVVGVVVVSSAAAALVACLSQEISLRSDQELFR